MVATVTVTLLGPGTGADVIEGGSTIDVGRNPTSLVVSPEGTGNLGSCDIEDTASVVSAGREVSIVAVGAEDAYSPACVVGETASLVVSPEGTGILGSCDAEDTAVEVSTGREVLTAEVTAVGARPVGVPSPALPPPTRDPNSAAFARPILYAASSGVVHPTLVPAVSSSGIEKHLVGAEHGDTMIYIPSEPHWAKAPLIQAF